MGVNAGYLNHEPFEGGWKYIELTSTVAYKYKAWRSDEKRGALAKSAALWGLNGVAQYTSAPSD